MHYLIIEKESNNLVEYFMTQQKLTMPRVNIQSSSITVSKCHLAWRLRLSSGCPTESIKFLGFVWSLQFDKIRPTLNTFIIYTCFSHGDKLTGEYTSIFLRPLSVSKFLSTRMKTKRPYGWMFNISSFEKRLHPLCELEVWTFIQQKYRSLQS